MTSANTRTRYGTVAMTLHWIIAALVLTNLYLGLSFDDYASRVWFGGWSTRCRRYRKRCHRR